MNFSTSLPRILLITDDDVENGHVMHIFSKYHFLNSIIRLRRPREVARHLSESKTLEPTSRDGLPELVIFSTTESSGTSIGLVVETLKKEIAEIPLVLVANNLEEENTVRALNLPNTYCLGKPLGFFKLLEAMQKLGMFWVVMRSPP